VLLGVRRSRDSVRIQVWDTGPGIPHEQLGTIFDEFSRGASTSVSGDRGLGLGLSLADRMARLLGHRIEVRSELGRGTLFCLEVERVAAGNETSETSRVLTPVDEAQALTGCQILCVDDDEASLEALTGLLERWHAECITAPATDAAAIVADLDIQIAVLDFDLGDETPDGLALAAQLLRVRNLRCLLITANRDRTIVDRAREMGVTVLYKPLEPAKLRATLATLATLARG
jgi:CheY-like chemotaxis protein